MGYTTDFRGSFTVTPTLKPEDREYLVKLNETRRMIRKFPNDAHGIEGEFFVEGKGSFGQDDDPSVVDHNRPPKTQPGLWCQWRPNDDGTEIEWDGNEKFYDYVEWIAYLVGAILEPRGYELNGSVEWRGEDWDDTGQIVIDKNDVQTLGQGELAR
jgi:hypothetical protein